MADEWRKEAASFASGVLGVTVPGEDADAFHEALKSGVLLIRLLNALAPNTASLLNLARLDVVLFTGSLEYRESKMPFVRMENIVAYIEGCRRVGVPEPELFMTSDLFEARQLGSVVKNIMALKRMFGKGMKPGVAAVPSAAPAPAPAPTAAAPTPPKAVCSHCHKSVYPMELLQALGCLWHKACFRCAHCQLALQPQAAKEHEGSPVCKRCFESRTVDHMPADYSPTSKWAQQADTTTTVVSSSPRPLAHTTTPSAPANPAPASTTTPLPASQFGGMCVTPLGDNPMVTPTMTSAPATPTFGHAADAPAATPAFPPRALSFLIPFKPALQTDTTPASGDALRACVAAIFAQETLSVPNFIADERGYLPALQEWLRPHRLAFMKVPLKDGALPFPLLLPGASWLYCILAGPSPRGAHKHCVVGKIVGEDGKPVPFHDPHPAGGMLAGPAEWCGVMMALTPQLR